VLLRDLLNFSDQRLVQEIYELEKRDPEDDAELNRFGTLRSDLSRMAWNSFAAALGCDAGAISRTGVAVFSLDESLADRLLAALLESSKTPLRHDDFAMGYVRTAPSQCDYMNECNEYRELTTRSRALLSEFLSANGQSVERAIGHPFRVGSTRQFQLVPRTVAADRHLDGWPVAIRKIFILPRGAGRRSGTTWFRQRDGEERTIESDKPIWMIFENSVVLHAPVTGQSLRPTIEFDILPAQRTSLEPVSAGLAGWYPWFPTEAGLLEGTRVALMRCYPDEARRGWRNRLRHLIGN
jgi:hypothetical protein